MGAEGDNHVNSFLKFPIQICFLDERAETRPMIMNDSNKLIAQEFRTVLIIF